MGICSGVFFALNLAPMRLHAINSPCLSSTRSTTMPLHPNARQARHVFTMANPNLLEMAMADGFIDGG
jgi:hypothetical protein